MPDILDVGQVLAIHYQHVVEGVQILWAELARPQPADINAPAHGGLLGPGIRTLANMPVTSATGIDLNLIREAGLLHQGTKNSFRTG